ncbi:MAG TPA: chromate efflux transporter [Xanthobacteraceae bacterium]|nr:chromate efflux transporter [Xanthobacteraceae bacterium]
MTTTSEVQLTTGGVAVPTFGEAFKVWFRVGCLSFGGPAGQIATMHRILVDEKKWIDEPRYLHALNYCMLLPGPEAQQLATYVGWTLHGLRGGLAAGLLFILPGALVMLGLSFVYVLGRGVPLIDGALYGIKAAVLVIVVEAIIRIGKRGLKTRLLMALAAVAFIAIYLFEVPFPLIVIPAASIGYFVARTAPAQLDLKPVNGADAPPRAGRWREAAISAAAWLAIWWAPVLLAALALGPGHVLVTLGVFFSKLAVVSFGGAYALLAYMAQQAVENYGWLKPGEMVDALGLAETTPGPLILVTQFVSFLAAWRSPAPFDPAVAATLGAAMATWTVFAPSFLWIFAGAPFLEDLRRNQKLAGALAAITAAVVGVILSLAVWFALHVLFRQVTEVSYGPLRWFAVTSGSIDGMAVALAGIAAILVFVRHVGMIATVVIMAALGIAARLAFGG